MRLISYLIFSFIALSLQAQTIIGIDVSHHQNSIDWQQVAGDGISFAYVKATEGMTYLDPRFTANMTGGQNAGVIMGAYHFARPDNNTATDDANNFITHASSYVGNGFLPPVLDLENPNSNTDLESLFTSAQLTNWVITWMQTVETQTGVRPVVYTSTHLANYLQSSVNTYGLWIAKPGTSPATSPVNIGVWNTWLFKQYSWNGSVSGISGNVDMDVFHGTTTDFNSMIGGGGNHNAPANDDCEDAIELQSNLTCVNTLGTVDDATPSSNLAPAACDAYSGTPAAEDVFYKFTASRSAHTITVTPTGNLDAILALYEGTTCSNLTELDCVDTPGGNGVTTVLNTTGLSIGQTYWIRIYDYGSVPPSAGDFDICITHAGDCQAPDNINEQNITDTSLSLVIPFVPDATEYEYTWTDGNANTQQQITTGHILYVDGLTPGATYQWQARIKCNGSWTAYSSWHSFTMQQAGATCAVPTGLTSSSITDITASLAVAMDMGAQAYNFVWTDGTNSYSATSAQNAISISGLQPQTLYHWKVKKQCNNAWTDYSAESSFTTDVSAVVENMKDLVKVFPNPVNNQLNILVNGNLQIKRTAVYNITGILLQTFGQDVQQINTTAWKKGLYFVQITSMDGRTQIYKIIKQ